MKAILIGSLIFLATIVFISNNRESRAVTPGLIKFVQPQVYSLGVRPSVVKLAKGGRGYCTAFIIDDNYALTAAHCLKAGFFNNKLDNDELEIRDASNVLLEKAKAVAFDSMTDVGLIAGNFKMFDKLKVNFYGFTRLPSFTCGYPMLQNKITCTEFLPTGGDKFFITGPGFLIRGMSGGPVLDRATMTVYGINSAFGTERIYVAPLLGLLGDFGIE